MCIPPFFFNSKVLVDLSVSNTPSHKSRKGLSLRRNTSETIMVMVYLPHSTVKGIFDKMLQPIDTRNMVSYI